MIQFIWRILLVIARIVAQCGIHREIINSQILMAIHFGSQKVGNYVCLINPDMHWSHGLKIVKFIKVVTGALYMNWMIIQALISFHVTYQCTQVNVLLLILTILHLHKIIHVFNTVHLEVVISMQFLDILFKFYQF